MDFLNNLVAYADEHNGASMVWLTFAYVIASVLMAVAMFRANSLSNRSIQKAEKLEIDRTRPHVLLDIEVHDLTFYYTLKNIGLTSAKSVRISIAPEPIGCTDDLPAFLRSPIPTLAPGRTIESLIDSTFSFYRNNDSHSFSVSIKYSDVAGNEYNEESTIDLSIFKNSVPRSTKDKNAEEISRGVREIGGELARIRGYLHSISKEDSNPAE